MAVKMSQSLKQTQSLMMTPQLQQAIKLLTLTHMEMTNVISQELVENPMLEETGIDNSEKDYNEDRLETQNKEATADSFNENQPVERDDFDWDKYVDSYNTTSSSPANMATPDPDEIPNYENMISSNGQSLTEHLEWQLRMEELEENALKIGLMIIHNLNDDGYLNSSFDEIVETSGESRELCEDIRQLIVGYDPVGCACETLSECLLAQARIAEERSPLLEKIIREHLEDLKRRDLKAIADKLGVKEETVEQTAALLQEFHPKPGRLISAQDTQYVVPDIFVKKVGEEFVVQVNDDGVPRLRISNLYRQMLKKGANKNSTAAEDEASKYVQEKLSSALWLIKSIQNRQRTIYKVAQALVRHQQTFFKKGPKYLKPMILKDIANEIGMHESTVSRVTTNKYMHTPIGVFELKYFFNTGIGGKNGGVDVSSEVLKLKIKELVESENPKKPLSDQKIADLLSREDVKVARRTVAKYRETLGIDSSSRRKVKS